MSKKPRAKTTTTTTENPDYYAWTPEVWTKIDWDEVPLVCSPGFDCEEFSLEMYISRETVETMSKIAKELDKYLGVVTFFITIIHLFFLTRKELRTNFVFIIMIGITISEFLIFSCYLVDIGNEWYFNYKFPPSFWCTYKTYEYHLVSWIKMAVLNTFGLAAVLMALLMAIIRSVTVMFPMSNWIQKLMTVPSAIFTIVLSILISFGWKCVYFLHGTISKVDIIINECPNPELIYQVRPTLTSDEVDLIMTAEIYVSIFCSVCYVIATVLLVIELIRAKKRKANLKNEKKTNTIGIVIAMAVSFLISELLLGVYLWITKNAVEVIFKESFENFYNFLVTVNDLLHMFFCFMMSSQYREVVFKTIKCGKSKIEEPGQVFEHVSSLNSANSAPSVNTVKTDEFSK